MLMKHLVVIALLGSLAAAPFVPVDASAHPARGVACRGATYSAAVEKPCGWYTNHDGYLYHGGACRQPVNIAGMTFMF
jgi:hypothetical protein